MSPPPAIVYVTLEYCADDLFSGNGVAARSHVRTLAARGHRLHIVAGRPRGAPPPRAADTPPAATLHPIPLAAWRTTDRAADHAAFARAAADVLARLAAAAPLRALLLVDWTAAAAVEAMEGGARARLLAAAPAFFLNFRVYCRMAQTPAEDLAWYREREAAAVRRAVRSGGGVVALSEDDCAALRAMDAGAAAAAGGAAFKVIPPMLRDEFAAVARRDRAAILDPARRRRYLACLVRLSKDKGAHRFVDVCDAMTRRDPDVWRRAGVVPLMVGAASQPEFAARVRSRFRERVPCGVVVDDFLSPPQLADVLAASALNVHPSLYEAYGMTIVEAGACGCPSLVHREGIGAAQLMAAASIAVDMADIAAVAELCAELLLAEAAGARRLADLGRAAHHAATSWTEDEHVAALLDFVDGRASRRAPLGGGVP